MADDKKKSVLPKYDGVSTKELVDKYVGYNDISAVRKRQRTQKKNESALEKAVDDMIGDKSPEDLSFEARRAKAAEVVTHLAEEWYKSLGISGGKDKDKMMELYLTDAGIRSSYKELLDEIANSESDLSISGESRNRNLLQLKRHTAEAKDADGLDAQKVARTILSDHNHWKHFGERVGKITGEAYHPGAKGHDIIQAHQRYLQTETDKSIERSYHAKKKAA